MVKLRILFKKADASSLPSHDNERFISRTHGWNYFFSIFVRFFQVYFLQEAISHVMYVRLSFDFRGSRLSHHGAELGSVSVLDDYLAWLVIFASDKLNLLSVANRLRWGLWDFSATSIFSIVFLLHRAFGFLNSPIAS